MINIDQEYLREKLSELLQIHSPTGYTDPIVRAVCEELDALSVDYELTRRGAIRAILPGKISSPDRAVVAHVDTLGGMVKALKPNGRLAISPVGHWSARFAEGARVSVFTDETIFRGTILPLKASGHTYNDEIDSQPSSWDNLEIRIDADLKNLEELEASGFNVGDFVGVDSSAEVVGLQYINARHLDDKAGVASVLAAVKALKESKTKIPVDCHLLFTITEEVGSGASAVLDGDISELLSIDNGTCAPGQNSHPTGVTIAMGDSTGPFDYHLTHHLIQLCQGFAIPHSRDIFRHYRCDSASAVAAGNDLRTALVAFGLDASHGYERCHFQSLYYLSQLICHYIASEPIYKQQTSMHNTLKDFPETRLVEVASNPSEEPRPIIQVPPPAGNNAKKKGRKG